MYMLGFLPSFVTKKIYKYTYVYATCIIIKKYNIEETSRYSHIDFTFNFFFISQLILLIFLDILIHFEYTVRYILYILIIHFIY